MIICFFLSAVVFSCLFCLMLRPPPHSLSLVCSLSICFMCATPRTMLEISFVLLHVILWITVFYCLNQIKILESAVSNICSPCLIYSCEGAPVIQAAGHCLEQFRLCIEPVSSVTLSTLQRSFLPILIVMC